MSSPRTLPVVCAIISDPTGRVLLAQRPPHKHLGLKWEFPGGKVETGEPPENALIREIREELGAAIRVTGALPSFEHDYGSVVIKMLPFHCTLLSESPKPHPLEHVALGWVNVGDLKTYDLAPADWPIVEALVRNNPVARESS